jgi:cytochrome P450
LEQHLAERELEERLDELVRRRRQISGSGTDIAVHKELTALREQAPVHQGSLYELLGLPAPRARDDAGPARPRFTAVSWEAVDRVYRDNVTFSSELYSETVEPVFGRSILQMGGAEHRRYRALVQPAFTRSLMERWQQRWIAPLLGRLLSAIDDSGFADLESAVCAVLPVSTIAAGFGIPPSDARQFHVWSAEMLTSTPEIDSLAASRSIAAYLRPLIEQRREVETDDVLGLLAHATFVDEVGEVHRLTDDEILGFARLMLPAGAGTTWRQMGIILSVLLGDPDLLARVMADRSLMHNVIEESLRWEPNLTSFSRLVTDHVSLGGMRLPPGAEVDAVVAAANRDPSRWEDPDVYDIDRPLKPHLAFGSGQHACIGMHLARTELTCALNSIFDQLPGLRLAAGAEPPQVQGVTMRFVTSLPVEFDSR